MLNEVCSLCRACKGYRVHCRDTQTFPEVHRHTLTSNTRDPYRMETRAFIDPIMSKFAIHHFFRHPVSILQGPGLVLPSPLTTLVH